MEMRLSLDAVAMGVQKVNRSLNEIEPAQKNDENDERRLSALIPYSLWKIIL
jgi:hypothetical protein